MSVREVTKQFARRAVELARKAPGSQLLPLLFNDAPYSASGVESTSGVEAARRGFFGRPEGRQAAALRSGRVLHPRFVFHIEYCPPPSDVVFVSVCNDKYLHGLEAVVLSLQTVYPGMANRYVVYHDASLSAFSQARLLESYSHFEFVREDPSAFRVKMGMAYNHKRVGLLGYLSLHALKMAEPSHVVILDSDLLIMGDISPLWSGDNIRAVPDIGSRPFGIRSEVSGKPIINSGVLSLPRNARGPRAWKLATEVLDELEKHPDVDIEMFADQRFWNVFLAQFEVEHLPQNFNAIKTLITRHFYNEIGNVSILHMTGPKPWYAFSDRRLLGAEDKREYELGKFAFRAVYALWDDLYRRELLRVRLGRFRSECVPQLETLAGACIGKRAVMIGNGPSIQETDLEVFDGYEKFAFNWFVNHEQFDIVKPDHLVIASHMIFGGWSTLSPSLPDAFLKALRARSHRPRLWFPYYFRAYVKTLPELEGYPVSYFFYEKPFKRTVGETGRVGLDLREPLIDCNTGVLTAGIPIALHLGITTVTLVGCDSKYSSAAGSYFYSSERHESATTNEQQLLRTWSPGGEGRFGYRVMMRELESRGVELRDATVGGALTELPRISLQEARLGSKPSSES